MIIHLPFIATWSIIAISWSGPGLYNMHMLYLCMCSIMHCSCCDEVVTSLLTIAMNALWSVITLTCMVKQSLIKLSTDHVVWQGPVAYYVAYTAALHSIHSCSQMQWDTLLCCLEPCFTWQFMPSLTCQSLAPGPIPDASVSRYRGYDAS